MYSHSYGHNQALCTWFTPPRRLRVEHDKAISGQTICVSLSVCVEEICSCMSICVRVCVDVYVCMLIIKSYPVPQNNSKVVMYGCVCGGKQIFKLQLTGT